MARWYGALFHLRNTPVFGIDFLASRLACTKVNQDKVRLESRVDVARSMCGNLGTPFCLITVRDCEVETLSGIFWVVFLSLSMVRRQVAGIVYPKLES